MILLAVATLFLVLNLSENDTEPSVLANTTEELPVLTDSDIVAEIESYSVSTEPQEVFDFRYDAMDRGNRDYYEHPLLIDPEAFQEKEPARGDVVVFEAKFFNGPSRIVGRIIALPGETMGVINGQIYVNDRKLDIFYGQVYRMGTSSVGEFNKWFEENSSSKSTTTGMEELFQMDIAKFTLSEYEVYTVGDD